MEEKQGVQEKRERGLALYFLAAVILPFLPALLAPSYPLSTRVAAGGGLLAALGGLAIIAPVIRAGGPYNWVTLEHYKEIDSFAMRMARVLRPN